MKAEDYSKTAVVPKLMWMEVENVLGKELHAALINDAVHIGSVFKRYGKFFYCIGLMIDVQCTSIKDGKEKIAKYFTKLGFQVEECLETTERKLP
jgi:hypothetical protein